MPRKKFYSTNEYPYHVTARTYKQEWFPLPMDEMWVVFSDYLHFIWKAYGVRVHAFVMMSNHFHMLVTTPEGNLDEAMEYFLREVCKRVNTTIGEENSVFGGPYHWSLIKNNIYYHHAYKYIYRNPVHAGICKRVEHYEYSSLRGLLGMDYLHVPAYDNMDLIANPSAQLKWLNNGYDDDSRLAIKKALHKKEFGFGRDRETGHLHRLEDLII
jgi:REP element-mobilizing transposase RayT